jgi:hypothetical protein
MQIAFHNGKGDRHWLVSLAIKIWPWAGIGKFSHVELVFPHYYLPTGNSFSSSGEDGGVRYKDIDYTKNSDRWQFIQFAVTGDEMVDIKNLCDKEVNKKYDFIGILGFFLLGSQESIQDKNKWWCSEIVGYVLGIRPFRVSPNKLFNRVRIGYVYRPSVIG